MPLITLAVHCGQLLYLPCVAETGHTPATLLQILAHLLAFTAVQKGLQTLQPERAMWGILKRDLGEFVTTLQDDVAVITSAITQGGGDDDGDEVSKRGRLRSCVLKKQGVRLLRWRSPFCSESGEICAISSFSSRLAAPWHIIFRTEEFDGKEIIRSDS